jgi:hypothetical protein
MKKIYSLKVDEDIIPFEGVSINEDGSPTSEKNIAKVFAYENNPTIVNISSMTEIPSAGDIYDPSLEGFPFVRQSSMTINFFEGYGKFALVVDNLVKCILAFDLSTEHGYRLNAIFSSNPQFLEPEIIE